MSTFVLNQTQVFLIFILCGSLIGLLFDVFRILRKSFKTPDFITYIEDIVFWMLTCILIAYSIFRFNNGELRAYLFIGLFIGITIYILLISKFVVNISVKIIAIIKNIVAIILQYLTYPIKWLLTIFRKIFLKPISFICINFKKNMSKKVKNIRKKYAKKLQTRKDFT